MTKENHPAAQEFGEKFGTIGLDRFGSRSAMAKKLGVNRITISRIISGKSIISIETFGNFLTEIEPSDCQRGEILPPFVQLLQEGLIPDNNHTFSPSNRRAISKRLTGSKRDPSTIEKVRNANIGKRHTPDAIDKMRLKKQNMSETTRRKMSDSRKSFLERKRKEQEIVLNGNMPHVILPPELTPTEVI